MGIVAAIVSTAVAVIGVGEVFSMTAACLGAALLSHRLTLAVDHVTQLWWSWNSLGNTRHRDIIPNLPAEISDTSIHQEVIVGRPLSTAWFVDAPLTHAETDVETQEAGLDFRTFLVPCVQCETGRFDGCPRWLTVES